MGIFGGIDEVRATERKSIYLQQGSYDLTVERCKLTESSVGNKTFFVVEATVMSSDNDEISPGTRASWVVRLGGDYPNMALSDIKKFAIASTGADENEVDEEFMKELVAGTGDLVSGRLVQCVVEEHTTKRGGTFSKHFWSSTEGDDNN
jgi:hypothetical protein